MLIRFQYNDDDGLVDGEADFDVWPVPGSVVEVAPGKCKTVSDVDHFFYEKGEFDSKPKCKRGLWLFDDDDDGGEG